MLNFSKSAEVNIFGSDMGQAKITHYNAFEDTDFGDSFRIRSELKVSPDGETMDLMIKYINGGRIKNLSSENI